MAYFKSIEDFKSKAEFFPKGRIVPKRIMNILAISNSKKRSRFKRHCDFFFASDTYVARVRGINIITNFDNEKIIMSLKGMHKNLLLTGNPYGNGGNLIFQLDDWGRFSKDLDDLLEKHANSQKQRMRIA